MKQAITIPELPESVADAIIASWTKPLGARVKQEDVLLELETDKVVLEVSAQSGGVLSEILAKVGATVVAGQTVGYIDTQARQQPPTKNDNDNDNAHKKAVNQETTSISPSVRRLLAEHNLKPNAIPSSGKKGRLLKSDVEAYLERHQSPTKEPKTSTLEDQTSTTNMTPSLSTTPFFNTGRDERRVPMNRIRSRIAERLLHSQQNTATLTTFNEVDLQEVIKLRRKYQERFVKVHSVKLGFMSFFIKAATEALKRYPQVNASIDGHDIVYHGYYDIGVAVSTERGLVVPILRDTNLMGLADIEKQIGDYAKRAQDGRLDVEELSGGTFSVSNGGVFGSLLSTPILNPPQSAILGMHTIKERPVAINGEVIIRPMMYLALSYDHRLIDGKTAVQFLSEIKDLLEEPASMLLEL